MTAPTLYIATDDPVQAAIDLFYCEHSLVPAWAKIVYQVGDIAVIPTDAKVINQWYGPGSLFEQMWREERQRRSFNMDYAAHVARLQAWHAKRWADAVDAPTPEPSTVAQFPNSFIPQLTPKQPRWS